MKLSHLSVLAALCAFSPSVASAITISNATQLTAALKIAKGGEVFDLAPGNYGTLSFNNRNFSSAITIRSANSSNRATFAKTMVNNSTGIRFDSVNFNNPIPASVNPNAPSFDVWGRSEERRVGTEVVRPDGARWSAE